MNDSSAAEPKPFNFYYNASQFRIDTWHGVKMNAEKLSVRHARKTDTSKLVRLVDEALTALNHLEDYTAFPSKEDFHYLWRLFENSEYATLARARARLRRPGG